MKVLRPVLVLRFAFSILHGSGRARFTMVAQECTSTSRPQRDRPCSALCPHYVRTTPVVFPHRFRSISAIFPHCSRGISALLLLRSLSAPFPQHLRSLSALFPRYLRTVAAVLPHCSRSASAVLLLVGNYTAERSLCQFRQVHLIEKTVAETLSDHAE